MNRHLRRGFAIRSPTQTRRPSIAGGRRPVVMMVVAIGFYACSSIRGPSSASEVSSPTSSADSAFTAEEVVDATNFRTTFGLRADEAWIRAVAADPASEPGRRDFGIPLLPDEYQDLVGRAAQTDDIAPLVAAYGAGFPDDWAGMFVDQQRDGVLVARFRQGVEQHRRALGALLPETARLEVREAEWSLDELRGFADSVYAEAAWFRTIGTTLFTVDVLELDNVIDARFDGPNRDSARTILEHFGNPPWLRATWNGPGPWEGPLGNLIIEVTDTNGRPVQGVDCDFDTDDPGIHLGEVAYGTNADGRCAISNLPAVTYRIEIKVSVDDSYRLVIGTGRATILPGGSTTARIVVTPR